MIWLKQVNEAGNWSGYAHLFDDEHSTRARCGIVRMNGEDWREAPPPLVFAKCRECYQEAEGDADPA